MVNLSGIKVNYLFRYNGKGLETDDIQFVNIKVNVRFDTVLYIFRLINKLFLNKNKIVSHALSTNI